MLLVKYPSGVLSPVLNPKYGWVKNEDSYCIDENENGILERFLRFDLSDVQGHFGPGEHTVTITGQLFDGTPFEGSDTLTLFDP